MDLPEISTLSFVHPNGSFHWVTEAERIMTKITRIGIDLGKSTFHVYAVDRSGQVVVEKKFTRRALERLRIGILKRQYTLVEKYRMGWPAWFER